MTANGGDPKPAPSKPLTRAGWIAVISLGGFFIVALVYAIREWGALEGVSMSTAGWIFMVIGALVTIALGGGLMALVFYSSRHGMDR